MAEKQKGWDMERVALLRKMRAALAAQPAEPVADVGLLEYHGNSVSYIHAKMCAYRDAIDNAWIALWAAGVQPDGKTSVAEAIARLAAPPAPAAVPPDEQAAFENMYRAMIAAAGDKK
jgi:hypothetical protein